MTTFWLNFHLAYACQHSGACCSSGWAIPVERDRVIPIRSLSGREDDSWLVPVDEAPADVAGTLAVRPNGECTFFRIPTDGSLPTGSALPTSRALPAVAGCAVHPSRPASCAHFPYVCLIDARGVHVTLSHYCPTAASMLFDHAGPITIVEGPSPIPGRDIPEGLDAREALPPLESPGRLMTFEALTAWERQIVATPWTATAGVDRARQFEHARWSVPRPLSWPGPPANVDAAWRDLVEPALGSFAGVVDRYLAAKAFASWAIYAEDGTAAVRRLVAVARAVLEVEAARACARSGTVLDAALLTEAIRQSDLLLVHYADRDRLHQPAGSVR